MPTEKPMPNAAIEGIVVIPTSADTAVLAIYLFGPAGWRLTPPLTFLVSSVQLNFAAKESIASCVDPNMSPQLVAVGAKS